MTVTTPYITIRGENRNTTIIDGEFERANGIQVIEADGVVIQNLTARNELLNGFYWNRVHGYWGSYLTAYNNGDYGIFAYDSDVRAVRPFLRERLPRLRASTSGSATRATR